MDAIGQELLLRFLEEEESGHVRQLLLRHISDCRAGIVQGRHTFAFNVFNVTIDCESNTVTLEDELDVTPIGEARYSLDEFSAALWR
jgi:hypothetical protein